MPYIPHDNFAAGFIVGWQTVKGRHTAIPPVPSHSGTPETKTPFLIGVETGLKKALGRAIL